MPLPDNDLVPRVRVMQIITFALLMGLVTFAGVVIVLTTTQEPPNLPEVPIITYMALGMLALCGTLSFTMPRLLAPNIVQKAGLEARAAGGQPALALVSAYQTLHIMACALCEGPGFFCLIAYFVERQPLALAGAAVSAVLIAMRFPTEGRVRGWVNSYSGGA